jgi:hypothetical protein
MATLEAAGVQAVEGGLATLLGGTPGDREAVGDGNRPAIGTAATGQASHPGPEGRAHPLATIVCDCGSSPSGSPAPPAPPTPHRRAFVMWHVISVSYPLPVVA